jgi:hypothetical protein
MLRLVLIASLFATACSDDPLSYSAPVSINLKAKSGDTQNSVVTDEKGITTENGNPYGAFEVFTGNVDVLFQMNDTNNTYPVAHRTLDGGTPAGPIAFDIEFPSDDVPDADYDKMLSGSFKVVVRGGAATGFETKGADADIQTTFTFAAFE